MIMESYGKHEIIFRYDGTRQELEEIRPELEERGYLIYISATSRQPGISGFIKYSESQSLEGLEKMLAEKRIEDKMRLEPSKVKSALPYTPSHKP
jgi:hypothetical protein